MPKINGVDIMICRHLYEIVSPKTNVYYMVWVEEYVGNFFAIKFHLRKDKKNQNKYSVLSGLFEARPIIISCLTLLAQIAKANDNSSFGFIGAGMPGDSELINTKRYRVYKRFVSTFVSEELFEHHFLPKKSAYLLVRKKTLEENPNYLKELFSKFTETYPLLG